MDLLHILCRWLLGRKWLSFTSQNIVRNMFWSTHGGHTHLSATRAWPHKSFSLFLFELTIWNTSGVCRSVVLGAGWANSHDYFLCILNIHTSKRSDGWSVKASVSCSRQSLSWGWSSLQNHAWPKLYPAPRMVLFVQCQSIFLLAGLGFDTI